MEFDQIKNSEIFPGIDLRDSLRIKNLLKHENYAQESCKIRRNISSAAVMLK